MAENQNAPMRQKQEEIMPPGEDQSSCLEFLLAQRQISNAAGLAGLVAVVGIAFSIFHLYAAYFGQGESYLPNTVHVALVMVMCFILKPVARASWVRIAQRLPYKSRG